LLHLGELGAAVLLRPHRRDPALLDEGGAPLLQRFLALLRLFLVKAAGLLRTSLQLLWKPCLNEFAHLRPKRRLLWGVRKVHHADVPPAPFVSRRPTAARRARA